MMVWVYSEICHDPILKERKKKEIIKIFKSFDLSIAVTSNITPVNPLNVNFDLTTDIYKSYRKPNDEPNKHSNHLPNIVREIPSSVSSRISNISSNQSIFNSSIPIYNESLTKSGFNDDTIYTPVIESNNSERNKTWKRKIIWFNPPYSMNVEINIGKTYLKLVKKHFSTATTLRSVIIA